MSQRDQTRETIAGALFSDMFRCSPLRGRVTKSQPDPVGRVSGKSFFEDTHAKSSALLREESMDFRGVAK